MKSPIPVLIAALLLLTGCSEDAAPSPAVATSAAATSAAPGPNASNGDGETVDDPPPNEEDKPLEELAPSTFKDPFVYPDGVKIDVVKIMTKRLTSSAHTDHDSKAGTPYVLLRIKVTNGTKKQITVVGYQQVMTYGTNGEQADAVQDEGVKAIDGKVLPGKSRTGTYGWVVAKKDRKHVQVEFDWDSDQKHEVALFSGPLKD